MPDCPLAENLGSKPLLGWIYFLHCASFPASGWKCRAAVASILLPELYLLGFTLIDVRTDFSVIPFVLIVVESLVIVNQITLEGCEGPLSSKGISF